MAGLTDGAGLTDADVVLELNGVRINNDPGPGPLPGRPADDAGIEQWRDYVTALGAGPELLVDSRHWDGPRDTGSLVEVPALDLSGLIELADRLGG